mmetsp:Transcript_6172/g.16473  ORF Transcript_6172/g.16473 Transcript_6172/m.16473 type:complete len:299 (-) Transcript_6172:16-912(-)
MQLEFTNLDIIYAEDECLFRELAIPGLLRLGIPEENIHVAEDGEEALAYLMELQEVHPSRPLVMMLDIRMPIMDGNTCAKKVREVFETLRRRPYLACFSAGFGDGMHDDPLFDISLPKSFGPSALQSFYNKVEEWHTQSGPAIAHATASAPASSPPASAPVAQTAPGAPSDWKNVDIVVADHEPICRMTVITMLGMAGAEDDDIEESGSLDELSDALRAAKGGSTSRPLIVFLAHPSWLSTVLSSDARGREPFVVSTAMDPGDAMTLGCHATLPRHFSHNDLQKVFNSCAGWWTQPKR